MTRLGLAPSFLATHARAAWGRFGSFSPENAGIVALLIGHLTILFKNAWVVEESYIGFRVVDNILHGYGPRFNVIDRVCVFTNPLWTYVMVAAAYFTKEVFFTAIWIQVALAAATAVLVVRSGNRWGAVLGLAALSLSKAYVDWATSGMENALGHLLFVLFLISFLRPLTALRDLGLMVFVGALCVLNRLDSVMLVGPPAVVAIARFIAAERAPLHRIAWTLVAAASPLLAWEMFSIVYYGFPVPNTYFAKITTGIPTGHLVKQGIRYLIYALMIDPLTVGVMAFGVVLAFFGPDRRALWPVGVGLVSLCAYIVYVGGDFMAGRFWSLPFIVSVAIAVRIPFNPGTGTPQCFALMLALLGWAGDFPTLNRSYYSQRSDGNEAGIGDYTRGSLWNSTIECELDHDLPLHDWVQAGLDARKHPETVPVWGAMGYATYYAGPGVTVIDKYALADGLLSHLPIANPKGKNWRIGHFERKIPVGYVESLEKRKNLIENKDLARFYDDILLVERGPIFSLARVAAMWRVWTGAHNAEIRRYAAASEREDA